MGNHTHDECLKRYGLYQQKILLASKVMVRTHSLRIQIGNVLRVLKKFVLSVLVIALTSISLSRVVTFVFRRSILCEMWRVLSIFVLYPALFFLLPYIFPTDSTDSPIGSYLLIRKTESQTIYYSTLSLKIFYKGEKMLYRQQLYLLVNSWVSKKSVHFLQYRSVETGVSYYFVWQPHTNLLWLNGASPQEFIRDGTKDYIKSLANK
ncbi:hypothetical protein VYI14_007435 [Streptococcus anginosus]|nr:hypothetical protein [Streptococcus anginosus]MED5857184.1 hypothetical protein [Streptococcus anginosus]